MLRKRIGPIAFVLAMGLLVREQCVKSQRVHSTIEINTGAAEPKVEAIDARVMVEGEPFGEVHRTRMDGMQIGTAQFKVSLPKADAIVEMDITIGGAPKHLTRRIHAVDDATVSLNVSDELL
jgi:hypothetical protein